MFWNTLKQLRRNFEAWTTRVRRITLEAFAGSHDGSTSPTHQRAPCYSTLRAYHPSTRCIFANLPQLQIQPSVQQMGMSTWKISRNSSGSVISSTCSACLSPCGSKLRQQGGRKRTSFEDSESGAKPSPWWETERGIKHRLGEWSTC